MLRVSQSAIDDLDIASVKHCQNLSVYRFLLRIYKEFLNHTNLIIVTLEPRGDEFASGHFEFSKLETLTRQS